MRVLGVLGLVTLVAVAGLVGCQPAERPATETAEGEAEQAPSDEEALRALAAEFEAAWNEADASAIAALYAPEGNLVDPAGQRYEGRQAIGERYRSLFSGMYQGTTIRITTTGIRMLDPEVALVDGSYEIEGLTSAEGEAMPAVKGLYLNVCVKQDGAWRIDSGRPMVPIEASGTT